VTLVFVVFVGLAVVAAAALGGVWASRVWNDDCGSEFGTADTENDNDVP